MLDLGLIVTTSEVESATMWAGGEFGENRCFHDEDVIRRDLYTGLKVSKSHR